MYREISMSDRNVCRVCGVIVPLTLLRTITEILVDIHEHSTSTKSLLDERYHLAFLDSFGDAAHQDLCRDTESKYHAWHEAGAKFSTVRKENVQRGQRQEYLESRIKELRDAKPVVGEKETLVGLRMRFADHEKIATSLKAIYQNMTASEWYKSGRKRAAAFRRGGKPAHCGV